MEEWKKKGRENNWKVEKSSLSYRTQGRKQRSTPIRPTPQRLQGPLPSPLPFIVFVFFVQFFGTGAIRL
jgi:hypothetical protein